eukprot:NODE_5485_length_1765_cov_5.769841.p2 GENE.NODE_5485_length_1765_cov_5.769841~~NODE_5485_length_1765_cov_5.769841.p2  ORF type:complete len:265 (+),score=86.98 NODE_5485_length_1765_cov_5.769841:72-797(+)
MGNIPAQDDGRNPTHGFRMVEMYNLKQLYYYLCLHTTTLTSCQLDRRQFFSVLAELKQFKSLWKPMFDAIDRKRDSIIDFDEFLAFVKVLKRGEATERRVLCFEILDFDHDGFADKGDVQYIARAFLNLKSRNVALSEDGRADKYVKLFDSVGDAKEGRFTREDFESYCQAHGETVVNETLEVIEHIFDEAIDNTGIIITATTVVNTKPHIDWQDHNNNARMQSWLCCASQPPVFTEAPTM